MEGKSSEIIHVTNALLANGYPPAVISKVLKRKKPSPELVPSPEELVGMFLSLTEIPRHGLPSLCPWYHRTPHTSSSK